MSAIKRLQQMLQTGDSEQPSTSTTLPYEGDSESVAGDVCSLMARCSMQGSSYLYQSVVVPVTDMAPSEVASVCSGVSSRSNLSSLRARLKGQSRGLWEITSHDSPEKETAYASSEKELTPTGGEQSSCRLHPGDSHGLRTPMTDSCISRSSVSSSEIAKSRSPSGKSHARHSLGGMFDSAIVTDFVSSEDESSSTCGGASTAGKQRSVRKAKEGVIRSAWLDRINEKPSPQHRALSRISRMSDRSFSVASEVSLEWCDHDFQDNPDDVAQ
ncbi:hypothetical protein AAVH_01880 [Aphelenchoides avenae]|nr:hypothetical protein AAVH_01880 [Aphelenchus avenae]